jgi:heat shock protein HslJ
MRNGFRRRIGALAMVGLLTACGSMSTATESPPLDGTSWTLSELPGRSLVAGSPVTLRFAEGRVSGSDGCNRYSGGYSSKGTSLEVSPSLAVTQMACEAGVMEQARVYVAALTGATSYRLAGDRLELLGSDGAALAALAAQSQTLAGTSWQATGINNGKQAVASVLNGSTVTMTFGADGIANGSAGCNRYSAHYEKDGAGIKFAMARVTRMMCAEPAGVMEQEQQFLNALSSVATARVEGDRLELRTADGALAVALARESPQG